MQRGHIYLIDDNPGRRDALAQALAPQGHALQKFEHAPAFLDWIDYERLPHAACVLTRLDMQPMTGVELLDVFHADGVPLPTVLIGTACELQLAVKAARYSGTYILWQPFAASLLVEVIAGMLREWGSSAHTALASECATVEDRLASLSRRQRQVLRHVFEGSGNRAIAAALGISIKTVELHRACMMRKMRADSVVALVRMMSGVRRSLEGCA